MLAGLLYLIGLVMLLLNLALAGFRVPGAVNQVTAALDAGGANLLDLAVRVAGGFSGYAWPLLIGLVLMGFGRVIMLLGAINRSLRGQP